jgi:alkyl hydroperoxide reductase subunit F
MSSIPISKEILQALAKYTASLKNKVSLVLQTGEHPKRAELASFLNQICSVSEDLLFSERDFKEAARSPLTFFFRISRKY